MDSQLELVARKGSQEIGRWTLAPGVFSVGRSAKCLISLDAEGIRDEHAQLSIDAAGVIEIDPGEGRVTVLPGQPFDLGTISLQLQPCAAPVEMLTLSERRPGAAPAEYFPSERYEVGGLVAKGGMGAILKARQTAARRTVAMKVLLEGTGEDAQRRIRFIEEAQITSQLEHPNIVPIHDVGLKADGSLFYTMKLVKGITLKRIIEMLKKGEPGAGEKYSLTALLTIFQKVCDAVAFAHSREVIHRDLKPENLMVGEFGEVLVMDWGLAKLIGKSALADGTPAPAGEAVASARADEGAAYATLAGSVMGTPAYMAPEQARGELDRLDRRTDIFALGVILYELLTLRRPFAGKTAAETMQLILSGEPPKAPVERNHEGDLRLVHLPGGRVPGSLSAVAMRALAFAPEGRYQSLAELQRDLTAYQSGFVTSAEERTAGRVVRLFLRRHRAVSVSVAAGLVLMAALTVAFTLRVTGERNRAEGALANLRKTAPTFAAQAQSLVEQQNLAQATEKLDFAIAIDPASPVYRLRRADLLQASLQFREAAAEYRRVLALGPDEHAQANLALTEKILAESPGDGVPPAQVLHPLYEAMRSQQRELEAVPLGARLGLGAESALPAIKAALAEYMKLPAWHVIPLRMWGARDRINREPDGTYALYLAQMPIQDLAPLARLRGLPISLLDLNGNLVSDLTPIAGLPLRELTALGAPIADLAPLRGMKLRKLELRRANIPSLEPLRGMPIEELSLIDCPNLTTLQALEKMPLRKLDISLSKISDCLRSPARRSKN